ncbi:hypothetical protein GF324_03055, partial [bacterium]|nr:hypothetical protein [bacterium]
PVTAQVLPLIETEWRNYTWPYNAYYPEAPDGVNGHIGNACGPTSIAHILKHHEFPIQGYGSLTFVSSGGDTWSANFGETTYLWEQMPDYLPPDATEDEYGATATLVYHAAVSMHDIWGSGLDLESIAEGMNQYLGYTDTAQVKNRWEHTLEEWNQFFFDELNAGRPILVCGRTEDSPPPWEPGNYEGHYWICDAYNDQNQFHLVYGYGDFDHYYDQDNFGEHPAYNRILIGLAPMEFEGSVELTAPAEGEFIQAGSELDIEWNYNGSVDEVRLFYWNDGLEGWEPIAENLDPDVGSYTWTVPEELAGTVFLRLHDQEEINLFDKTSFVAYGDVSIDLSQPIGGECFQCGSTVPILFTSEGIPTVTIQYSANAGADWTMIAESVNAGEGRCFWTVPATPGENYLVRVRADLDTTVADVSSSTFEVDEDERVGGPYATDDNTVLLLNFDGSAENQGSTADGSAHGATGYFRDGLFGMGEYLRIENTPDVNHSCVIVPSDPALNLTGDWTIEGWFKAASVGNGVCAFPIVMMRPGATQFYDAPIWISINNNASAFSASCRTPGGPGPMLYLPGGSLQTDEWYHLAYVRDTGENRLRLLLHNADRELVYSESGYFTASSELEANEEPLLIGGVNAPSNMQFDGWVDEVRISDILRPFADPQAIGDHAEFNNLPQQFELMSAYPNPFNPSTTVRLAVPETAELHLVVYNLLGQRAALLHHGPEMPGYHLYRFDASNLAAGIYFLRADLQGYGSRVQKLLLVK